MRGLYATDASIWQKNNTEDMLYLVDRYGYMPNGSRTWYLNRSQPPFLCMMVDRVFEQTGVRTGGRGFCDLAEGV